MSDLIGTKHLPPYFRVMRDSSRMASAYHGLSPYPRYGFQDWKTESRGPLPRCFPLSRWIVEQGASWLFGKPITFRCEGDDKFAEEVNEVWAKCRMSSKAVNSALIGGQAGGVVVGFSIDKKKGPKISLNVYHPFEQCRLYFDVSGELGMVRLQYPYYDNSKGAWFWHREDWDEKNVGTYNPIAIPQATGNQFVDPYLLADIQETEAWGEPKVKAHGMGVLPFVYIRNSDYGGLYGEGDLWRMFPLIDLYNFTLDLEHKDNQKRVDPEKVYIDLEREAQDDDAPVGPGSEDAMRSVTEKGGRVEIVEPKGQVREHIREYGKGVRQAILEACGRVHVSPEDITNKGNMTRAVMEQIHQPIIRATEAKRVLYGEDGYCKLFELAYQALANMGVKGYSQKSEVDVQIVWPELIPIQAEDKAAVAAYYSQLVQNNVITQDKYVEAVASIEGILDVDQLKKDLVVQAKEQAREAQKLAEEPKNEPGYSFRSR